MLFCDNIIPPMPKRLPLAEFKKIYAKVPRFCVDLIIKTDKGIVMSKRDIPPQRGRWHLPGGTVLFGEKIENAINRIAEEETGLKLNVEKIIDKIEYRPSSVHGHVISLGLLCTPKSGRLRGSKQGREIKHFKKIPRKTIKEQVQFIRKNKLL